MATVTVGGGEEKKSEARVHPRSKSREIVLLLESGGSAFRTNINEGVVAAAAVWSALLFNVIYTKQLGEQQLRD